MVREGCDENVPISKAAVVLVNIDKEITDSGSGKEPEEEEDGDADERAA